MNYLSQAKTISDNRLIKEQILAFENETGIRIPPIYKAFIENYDLEYFSADIFNQFYSPESKSKRCFETSSFAPNPEVVLYDFVKPSKYIDLKNNVYHYEEDAEIIQNKICIAEIAGGLLLLGYGESNRDDIYSDHYGNDDRLTKVADNIFDFLRNIELVIDEHELQNSNISTNDLYKKWGENFWRFKKSEK